MSPPNIGQPDPVAIRAHLEQVASDLLSRGVAPDDVKAALQRQHDYLTGALGRAVTNVNEQEAAQVPSTGAAALSALAQAPETVAAGVPGAKLLISAGRKVTGDERPFGDIQREVNAETSDVPYASAIGRTAGMLATTPFLPASGAASGAILGGTDQLLNNDPNSTLGERIGRGVIGAAAGGVLGKATDMLGAGVRGVFAKGGESAKGAALKMRSDAANPLYQDVESATPQPLTPEMTAMLEHPDIAPIAGKLKTLEQYKGKELNNPTLLMAIRKNLSDWGHQLDKQGAMMDPSKANLLGDLKEHVGLLKDRFDQAADTQVPGFSNAVQTFADQSVPVSAQEAGYNAMREKMAGGLTSWKNIGKKTPGSLTTFLAAHPDGGKGAAEGVLAAGRDAFVNGRRVNALWNAPSLLQVADKASGNTAPGSVQRALLALGWQALP